MPKGSVGYFIASYLIEHGPSSAYDLWKAWVKDRKEKGLHAPTYQSFYWNYIWRAKRLGLLEEVKREKGKGRFERVLLYLTPKGRTSNEWFYVQSAYREEITLKKKGGS